MAGGVESLNVSVASGVCLYEAVRQRRLPRLTSAYPAMILDAALLAQARDRIAAASQIFVPDGRRGLGGIGRADVP